MNAVGHFFGELAAAAISSPALDAGFAFGRFVLTLLP